MPRQPNIFPSPEHVQTLSKKSEPTAEHMRSKMPFATLDVPDVLFPGYEKRKPTEQENTLLKITEEYVNTFFESACEHPPSNIAMEHVRILKPISPGKMEPFPQENCAGRVGSYLNITLPQYNEHISEGARSFIHSSIHEFVHAKAATHWKVGERTMKQITGVSAITARTPNLEREKIPVTGLFFVALNEALTECITISIFAKISAADWYKTQFSEREKLTEEIREQYVALHSLRDEEISGIHRVNDTQLGVIVSYRDERKILETLITRITMELKRPYANVLSLFIVDYCNGTTQHIRPLLKKTLGKDALALLALWQPHRPEMARDLHAYLIERDPNIRDIIANNYLTNYKET